MVARLIYFIIAIFFTFCNVSHAKLLKKRHDVKLLIQNNGTVLYSKNAKHTMYPASLTKLMTLYLTFEAIKFYKLQPQTHLLISKKAASMPRSKIWLRPKERITVQEAIMSLIVRSANDSAVVLAENLAGSEQKFAKQMNIRAKQLGMNSTYFVNASGWHHRKQVTTAYDMAKLAIAIKRDFPEFYHLFSKDYFYYKNTLFKSNNYVLANLYGAEGLKTGYTSHAGWNIVTTAYRGNTRLIGVILGGKSQRSRDKEIIHLIDTYFDKNHIKTYSASSRSSIKKSKNTYRASNHQSSIRRSNPA